MNGILQFCGFYGESGVNFLKIIAFGFIYSIMHSSNLLICYRLRNMGDSIYDINMFRHMK